MKKLMLGIIMAVMSFLPLIGPSPTVASADGDNEGPAVWDIIDENFDNYTQGWRISSGNNANGTATQGDGVVTIVNAHTAVNNAFFYLVKTDFSVSTSEVTFEARVKVNENSTANEIGIRLNNGGPVRTVSIFLKLDDEGGVVQNHMQLPTQTMSVNVGEYHTYRVTVKANSTFDVYVDGEFAWSDTVKPGTGNNLIKFGSESPVTSNMEVDYFRMNTGIIEPGSDGPTPPPEPPPAPDFPFFRTIGVIIDPANMRYKPTQEYDVPTIIRADEYFDEPLGNYYLYYGPHDYPGGISLAYADNIEGPWHEYEANPIISNNWSPHYSVTHVASAHPIWMEDEGKLFMYFHGENTTTRLATSTDGITFQYEGVMVTSADFNSGGIASYARVYEHEVPGLNNKYIMLLMGWSNGNRIYFATSNDGRSWTPRQTPLINFQSNEQINHGGSISGAYYFPWEGRNFVTIHAASGHQYMVDVGENFDQEIHYGPYYEALPGYPDFGRAASRAYIQEGDSLYMVYEAGQRGRTVIALAKAVPPEDMLKLFEAKIDVQTTTMGKGSSLPLSLVADRYNRQIVDNSELDIVYRSSDASIVSVEGSQVVAHDAGSAEIWAEVAFEGVTLESNRLFITVRNEATWDIIDDIFDDYTNDWSILRGANATGSITQGDGIVAIEETATNSNGGFHYLTQSNFFVPESDYTFEVRAKVNGPSTGNEIGVRVNNRLVSIFLGHNGQAGNIKNRVNNPTQSAAIDNMQYRTYRVIVKEDHTYDVYVDGEFVWSASSVAQNNPNLVKIGADSTATSNMEIDYFRMNIGALVPDSGDPTDPPDPPDPLPAPEFPVFKYDRIVIDPEDENLKYNPTKEFDFPTVIRASDYFDDPLGNYYMYYGPHDAPGGIALAYSDTLEGPWTEYEANPIIGHQWAGHYNVSHVASAHPIWMEEEGKLFLYFHGENSTTRMASSEDGINFQYEDIMVNTSRFDGISEASYARVFEYTIPDKGNKYIMMLMGNNNGSRKIYLAWSDDGREWVTQRTPFISPINDGTINQGANLSGAYYFPWQDRHFVAVHAGSGHQYMVEVGENFDQEIHHGRFNEATGGYPDYGRVASRSFIQEDDTIYMFYEVGQRGSTKIALAKSVPPEDLLKLYEAEISIQTTTMSKGGAFPLSLVAKRYNRSTIDNGELDIVYRSSDSTILSVEDGIVSALEAGTAEVWAEISFEGVTLDTNRLAIEVRDEQTWDIIDERFDNYSNEWGISKGSTATGSITQGEGVVTIVENTTNERGGFHYLTKSNFFVPESDYTFEVRAKVNGPSTGNEIGVRVNNRLVSIFLSNNGQSGTIQNRVSNPSQSAAVDTSLYQTYRIIVKEDHTFDVYVGGEHVWSGSSVSQSYIDNLIKMGADSPATANLEIDYFKMNIGALVPEIPEPPLEPQDPPAGLVGVAPTASANNNGSITGTTVGMEYKLKGADNYVPVTGAAITGLEPGNYLVRYAARTGYSASSDVEIVVPAYTPPTPTSNPGQPTPTPGSGTPTATPTPAPTTAPTPTSGPVPITVPVKAVVDEASGAATAVVSAADAAELAAKAKESAGGGQTAIVQFKVEADSPAAALRLVLPKAAFEMLTADGNTEITIDSPIGSLSFDAKALRSINEVETDGEISISIAYATLTDTIDQSLSDRPVYEFTVTAGDRKVSSFGGSSVRVSVPYKLQPGEEPGSVIVYHVSESGELEIMRGKYSHASGTVDFVTPHFSQFAIGYNKVTFDDVPSGRWYSDAIGFMAARSLTNGTGEGKYSPEAQVTRGQFIVLLMRAYGIQPAEAGADNFVDAGNGSYYTGYLAAAKQLGIATGVGGNRFAPEAAITRQDIVTLLYRALHILQELPADQSNGNEAQFDDAGQVADYAQDAFSAFIASGVVEGSGGKLHPTDNTTRAEAAQILYKLLSK